MNEDGRHVLIVSLGLKKINIKIKIFSHFSFFETMVSELDDNWINSYYTTVRFLFLNEHFFINGANQAAIIEGVGNA